MYKNKTQKIPDNGNRYMPRKMQKLEKIQKLMVKWLDNKMNNRLYIDEVKGQKWMTEQDKNTKEEWERTMNYVLKCEDRPLTSADIKKLNFLYKFYSGEIMNMSLDYLNSLRSSRLPQNLVQAMRDCFGSHTYERVDSEGDFHTEWIN